MILTNFSTNASLCCFIFLFAKSLCSKISSNISYSTLVGLLISLLSIGVNGVFLRVALVGGFIETSGFALVGLGVSFLPKEGLVLSKEGLVLPKKALAVAVAGLILPVLVSTFDLIHKFNKDYKCIFVGDAAMSPYEIEMVGGANEHYNNESGRTWLERARSQWPNNIWINPTHEDYWQYTQSTLMLQEIFDNKMVPLTLNGLDEGMKLLN